MITGRTSGSGKYSYHEAHLGQTSVMAAHMPEDGFQVRIVFKRMGEVCLPTLSLNDTQAELLWGVLKRMAANLEWDDKMIGDP